MPGKLQLGMDSVGTCDPTEHDGDNMFARSAAEEQAEWRSSLLIAAAFSLAARGSDLVELPAGTGLLRIQLTNAPFPTDSVESVDIWVVRVDAKLTEGDSVEAAAALPTTARASLYTPDSGKRRGPLRTTSRGTFSFSDLDAGADRLAAHGRRCRTLAAHRSSIPDLNPLSYNHTEMKTQTVFVLAFLAATSLEAQSASKPQAAKQDHAMSSGWKEMDAFHKLLGATFHPVEKSGDLKPLRASANDLSAAARAWAASTAPATCRTEALRTAVSTISIDALGIANQVLANAQDAELKASITKLHDKFEEVEKACGGHAGMKH